MHKIIVFKMLYFFNLTNFVKKKEGNEIMKDFDMYG